MEDRAIKTSLRVTMTIDKSTVGMSRLALEVINKAVQDYIKPSKTAEGRFYREEARKFLAGEGTGNRNSLIAWCGSAGINVEALQKTHKVGKYAEKEVQP